MQLPCIVFAAIASCVPSRSLNAGSNTHLYWQRQVPAPSQSDKDVQLRCLASPHVSEGIRFLDAFFVLLICTNRLLTPPNGYDTRSVMKLVQSTDALRLTGLSNNQLREWCGRRGIFQPSVPARGSGRLSLYSWQDILALRILLEIFTAFGGGASQWASGIRNLKELLDGHFFPSLWGKAAIFTDCNSVFIADASSISHPTTVLIIQLDPHLKTLVNPSAPRELQAQLPLLASVGSTQ